jgi:hypothetical protein
MFCTSFGAAVILAAMMRWRRSRIEAPRIFPEIVLRNVIAFEKFSQAQLTAWFMDVFALMLVVALSQLVPLSMLFRLPSLPPTRVAD